MAGDSLIQVLLVEDNPGDARLVSLMLEETGGPECRITHVEDLATAIASVRVMAVDVVLLDLSLPDSSGLETITRFLAAGSASPVVVLTGNQDIEMGLAAIKAGAQDYLIKGQGDGEMLRRVILYAIERKRSAQALHESETRFRRLADTVPALIWMTDIHGAATYLNRFWEELARPEGDDWTAILHPEDGDHWRAAIADALARPGEATVECRRRRQDGQWRWFLDVAVPRFSASNRCEGLVGVGLDITDRKRAEQAVAEIRHRNELILQSVADGICGLDHDGRISFINPAGAATLGGRPQDLIGQPLRTFLPADDSVPLGPGSDLPVSEGQGDFRRLDGGTVPVEYTATPLDQDSGMVGTVLVFRDITARLEAEAVLRAARDRAEAGERAKADFLAMISHEIRTPLNAIIGTTGLLMDSALAPEQTNHARIARKSAEALLDIINDILDFSKMEAGRLTIEQVPFDLAECLDDVVEILGPRAQDKALTLGTVLPADLTGQFHGDPIRLRQVLLNLVGNGVKFTPDGAVTTTAECLEADDSGRMRLRFTVQDTGVGIPEDVLPRLFAMFSQGSAATTRRFGGTGLGLAISKRLVEMMGGDIGVESAVGVGSRFWFTLPLERAGPPERPPLTADRTVLVVDPLPQRRALLLAQLSALGAAPRGLASLDDIGAWIGEGARDALVLICTPEGRDQPRIDHLARTPPRPRVVLVTDPSHPPPAHYADHHLVLPVTHGALVRLLRKPATPTAGGTAPGIEESLNILVVDDNAVNQQVAMMMLERIGHRVAVADNGRQALEEIDRDDYDVVFMDVQMPEMDGYDATRAIRALASPIAHSRIIAMTAGTAPEEVQKCLDAGMDDVVAKPVDHRQLAQVLARQKLRRGADD